MRKIIILTLVACAASIAVNSQTILFQDDFESYTDFDVDNAGSWTFVDLDGLPTYSIQNITFANSGYTGAYIVFNAVMTSPPLDPDTDATDGSNWVAHGGVKCMTSFAAVPDGTTNANNDWMISPQVTLAASNNYLTFWAKSASASFPDDFFNVAISTTDTNPASFTMIASNEISTPAPEWHKFEYNLDTYAGQNVYIAINYVGADQFALQIDDFTVSEGQLGTNETQIAGFDYFYSTQENILNLSADDPFSDIHLYNILGQQVLSQELSNTEENINLSSLEAGVYLAKVNINGKTMTFKILKKR